jgi:hypothetical protein
VFPEEAASAVQSPEGLRLIQELDLTDADAVLDPVRGGAESCGAVPGPGG